MGRIVSFGSLLNFCIQLERRSAQFYGSLARESPRPELILKLAEGNRRRASLLERIRRENVTEMVLEPIEELSADGVVVPQDSAKEWLEKAARLEGNLGKFYREAAEKAHLVLAEARRSFDGLARENLRRKAELEAAKGPS